MTFIHLLVCLWIVGVPAGYLGTRWANKAMGFNWTRNDRLFAITFSLLYGPLMAVLSVVLFSLHKLFESKWGNQDARW